jgi:type VI secretion system secreted protein VgrG
VVPLEESLAEHPAILVESVTHGIVQAVTELGGMHDATTYSNAFTAVRASVPFRPERTTPRPSVSGLLVGFVVDYLAEGPYGAVDDNGCYTVHLHLDTAPHPTKHSLPIRMIQAHAGASYGAHSPLRPGTEVMVAFLAGDPDRPVIVGAVPNAITPSPVVTANAQINKILRTETGIVIEARDLYPPENNATQQGPNS